jgi:membrane-bound inhibitor of C-type lysozyme
MKIFNQWCHMKKIILCIPFITSCSLLADKIPELSVQMSKPVAYLSKENRIFSVRYGKLSDSSLSFIKITLPDGTEKTLPRALSASGVRYLDERELEWWEHQGSICLSKRDEKTQQWLRCHWTLEQARSDKAL